MRFFKWLTLLVLAGGSFAAVVWLGQSNPEQLNRVIITVDIFGWSDQTALERGRVKEIMDLPIEYEKKQALVARTVFIGASEKMVALALGNPRKTATLPHTPEGREARIVWQYHFAGDPKPTLFEFEEGKLMTAYTASALDVQGMEGK